MMKKIINYFKSFNDVDRGLMISVVVVTILLIINAIVTFQYISVFRVKEQSGNNRWLEVEAIINDTNKKANEAYEKVIELDTYVHNLENKLNK